MEQYVNISLTQKGEGNDYRRIEENKIPLSRFGNFGAGLDARALQDAINDACERFSGNELTVEIDRINRASVSGSGNRVADLPSLIANYVNEQHGTSFTSSEIHVSTVNMSNNLRIFNATGTHTYGSR